MTQFRKTQEGYDKAQSVRIFESLCEDFLETEGQDPLIMDHIKLIYKVQTQFEEDHKTWDANQQNGTAWQPLAEDFEAIFKLFSRELKWLPNYLSAVLR